MIAFFDVGYGVHGARVGCLTATDFGELYPSAEWVVDVSTVAAYVPGEFWRRELDPLLRGFAQAPGTLEACVIDAYVDLGADRSPGLGRILHQMVGVPVIGVAKSRFHGTPLEFEVHRRSSSRPLFVSAAGLSLSVAKQAVQDMAGSGRIPKLVRRADQLSRGAPIT